MGLARSPDRRESGRQPGGLMENYLISLRYEQAILFGGAIGSQQDLPAGAGGWSLRPGPGGAIDAAAISRRLAAARSVVAKPVESPDTELDFSRRLQAASITAFWWIPTAGSLLEFLKSLPTSPATPNRSSRYMAWILPHYRSRQAYYPRYFQGRWRANVLYNLDLALKSN
jgi:hypothetical protein